MAFPTPRHVRPLASAHSFSRRALPRIVEANEPANVILFSELTLRQLDDCPILTDLKHIDPILYISHFCGVPCLVRGLDAYVKEGTLVFSNDLKHYTRLCSARVSGNRIKFNYGSEEVIQDRVECYQFALKRLQGDSVERFTIAPSGVLPPLVLLRDEDECRCCYNKLTENNVACKEKHQICLDCFKLLHTANNKKCPFCNVPSYPPEAYEKLDVIQGKRTVTDNFIRINLCGQNSFKEFVNNEAFFLGVLRYVLNTGFLSILEKMVISSFFNWYHKHPDAFNTYDFSMTNQTSGNIRTFREIKDGDYVPSPLEEYITKINTPEIYNDVANTDVYFLYDDVDFFRDLTALEGNISRLSEYPNDTKRILQREIFFRTKMIENSRKKIIDIFNNVIGTYILKKINSNTSYFVNNLFRKCIEPQSESDAPPE